MLSRFVLYEIKYKILRNSTFGLLLIFHVLNFILFIKNYQTYQSCYIDMPVPCIGDYLFWYWKGMKEVTSNGEFFIPDVMWVVHYSILFYLLGANRTEETDMEYMIIIRMHSKVEWWIAKCIWCLYVITISGLITVGFAYIIGVIYGNYSLVPQDSVMCILSNGIFINNISAGDVMFILAAILCVFSALAMIQQMLLLFLNRIVVFGMIFFMLIFSIYVSSPILLGNYLMMIRYSVVGNGFKIFARYGIVLGIIYSVLCVIVGGVLVNKRDFLTKRLS